jgi:hypothetical protein
MENKLILPTIIFISALIACLMLVQDIYLQIFAMWITFEAILRNVFHVDPHPVKTFLPIVALVIISRLVLWFLPPLYVARKKEHFGDDTLSDCQVQIDLDRQKMFQSQDDGDDTDGITRTLNKIDDLSKTLEDFLHVNKPDNSDAGDKSMKNPV